MKPIKVLVVEQNILARQAIAATLRKNAPFKVAGVFGNVEQIEQKVKDLDPDVILLDIESPDGIEILKNLKSDFPQCPVVVLSRRSPEGAKLALSALEAGALDVITKPRLGQNLLFASRHFTKRLIPITEMAARLKDGNRESTNKSKSFMEEPDTPAVWAKESEPRRPKVLVIGACTGGPVALNKLVSALPEDFDIPTVIVQHFPKYYTTQLAENLDRQSKIKVREVSDGVRLKTGTVWVAPGGYHCEVSGWSCKPTLKVHKGPRELDVRPSINILFRSAANIFGRDVLAVLLSGHGEDGLEGIKSVKTAGGMVLVQHPESALVPDMPHKALQDGLVDFQYVPEKMAEKFTELQNNASGFIPYSRSGEKRVISKGDAASRKDSFEKVTNH